MENEIIFSDCGTFSKGEKIVLLQYEGAFVSAQLYQILYQTPKTPIIYGRLFDIRWVIQETIKRTFNMREDISH